MSKTAAGLIAFAKSKIGTPYVYGAKGAVMGYLHDKMPLSDPGTPENVWI